MVRQVKFRKTHTVTLNFFLRKSCDFLSRFAAEPSSFSGIVGGGDLLCCCQIQEQSVPEGVTNLNIYQWMWNAS